MEQEEQYRSKTGESSKYCKEQNEENKDKPMVVEDAKAKKVNNKNKKNNNKLSIAVKMGKHLEVKRALSEGADPDTCTSYVFPNKWGGKLKNVPVLTVATDMENVDVVHILLKAKADTEIRGDFQLAPLGWAIMKRSTAIVEKLIKHGADIHARDSKYGGFPIHNAAIIGHVNIAKMLKDNGSCLDVPNNYGYTPLHLAELWNKKAMCKWLLEQGIDISSLDKDEYTAADIAEYQGHKELGPLIRQLQDTASAHVSSEHSDDTATVVSNLQHHIPSNEQNNFYRVSSNPRGIVYIFNNSFVGEHNNARIGSENDVKNLDEIFKTMGYKVKKYFDKTRDETMESLNHIQSDHEVRSVDSFILVILSHGKENNYFYANDMKAIDLDDVRYMFVDSKCHALKGKPKIFLSSFCRGSSYERKIEYDARNEDQSSEVDVPRDMITIYASINRIKAARDPTKGTVFVQSLCKVLKKNAASLELNDIYIKLGEEMRKNDGTTPESQNYGFKKFYFNPIKQML